MKSAHKQATNTQSAICVNTPSSTSHENCLPAHTSPDHVSTTVDVTVQGTEDNNSGEDIPLKRQNLKTLTETKECIDTAVMPAPKISIGENCYTPMVKSLVTSICDKSTSPRNCFHLPHKLPTTITTTPTSLQNCQSFLTSPGKCVTAANHDQVQDTAKFGLDMAVLPSAPKEAPNMQLGISANTPPPPSPENSLPVHNSPGHVTTAADVNDKGTEDNNAVESIPAQNRILKTPTATTNSSDGVVLPAPKQVFPRRSRRLNSKQAVIDGEVSTHQLSTIPNPPSSSSQKTSSKATLAKKKSHRPGAPAKAATTKLARTSPHSISNTKKVIRGLPPKPYATDGDHGPLTNTMSKKPSCVAVTSAKAKRVLDKYASSSSKRKKPCIPKKTKVHRKSSPPSKQKRSNPLSDMVSTMNYVLHC